MASRLPDPPRVALLTALSHVTFAVYAAMVVAPGPTLPAIARSFGLTLGEAGTIFAASGVGFILVVFAAGYAADHLGKRGVLVAGLMAAALGVLGIGLAPSFGVLLAGAVVQSLGSGLLESAVGSLVVDLHPDRRPAALNLLHSFFGWGALVGPLLAGVVLLTFGWRWVYLGLSVAFVGLTLVILRLGGSFPPPTSKEPARWREVRGLLGSRLIQLGVVGILLYVAAELSVSGWSFPYLESARGYPTMVASLGVSLFWGGIAVGRWGSNWLASRLAPTRLVQGGAILFAAGTGALLLLPTPYAAVAALAVAGLGAAPVYPTIMAAACGRFPRLSGTVTGLITTATALGSLIGPTAVGRLGDLLGLQHALVTVVVAMLVLTAVYRGDDPQDAQDK